MSRRKLPDTVNVKYVQADVFDVTQLENALTGVEVAFNLLHSIREAKNDRKEFAT